MDIWISKRKRTTTLNEEPRFQAINVSQGGRYNNRVDSVVDIIRPRPKKDMTHEISSTTSCTTVTRATTLEKTRRIFKIITLESQKKWPLIIKFQLEDEACKNHRLKKRGKGEILFIFDRLFQNTFQHLPLPFRSPHNIPFNDDSRDETSKKRSSSKEKKKKKRSITFLILARRDPPSSIDSFKHFPTSSHFPHNIPSLSALHNSTHNVFQTFPNIPLVRRKKKKRFQGSTTRSSNSSLSNPRPWTVSREPVMRRRNLAGLPGYQVDSEAESPGRRVHLRGCKARGSVGNRHRRAAASVRVFAWARTRPYCRGVGRIGGSSRKRRVRAGHSGGAGAMTSHRGNLVVVG